MTYLSIDLCLAFSLALSRCPDSASLAGDLSASLDELEPFPANCVNSVSALHVFLGMAEVEGTEAEGPR